MTFYHTCPCCSSKYDLMDGVIIIRWDGFLTMCPFCNQEENIVTNQIDQTKQVFASGAQRDAQADKLRYDLISPLSLKRLAQVFTDGAKKYGDRNWEKGMPMMRTLASLLRHLEAWRLGQTDEDHLAQAAWNAMALVHYDQAIKNGILPDSLDDHPRYKATTAALLKEILGATSYTQDQVVCDASCHPPAPKLHFLNVPLGHIPAIDRPDGFAPGLKNGATVYISGPMRGIKDFNFPEFDRVAELWTNYGFKVISPADLDREDVSLDNSQRKFALRDTKEIITHADALVMLQGWWDSKGATAEFALAKWLELPVYYNNGYPGRLTLKVVHNGQSFSNR